MALEKEVLTSTLTSSNGTKCTLIIPLKVQFSFLSNGDGRDLLCRALWGLNEINNASGN